MGDNGHFLRGIDCELGTEESCIAHTVGVEVAAVGVADAGVTIGGGIALRTAAAVLTLDGAGMSGIGRGYAVGFPDVHFVAACSVVASSAVGISRRRRPPFHVGLEYERKKEKRNE